MKDEKKTSIKTECTRAVSGNIYALIFWTRAYGAASQVTALPDRTDVQRSRFEKRNVKFTRVTRYQKQPKSKRLIK